MAAALWGLWPLWVRLGVGGAPTATLAFIVCGVVGLPLALRERPGRPTRPRSAWLLLGVLGVCDAANVWLYFRALDEGAVAPAVLAHYLAPVMVALTAPLLLGERRSSRTPLALALALGGTALLVLTGEAGGARGAVTRAMLMGGGSAAFYAACVLLSKRLDKHFGTAELLAYHVLISAVVLLPITGLPPVERWLIPCAGGFISTLVAGLLYYVGLRRIPAERAGVLTYLEPVVAVLVGWAAFAERPPLLAAAGGLLVLAGGVVIVSARD
jgi:drug/metabolite transporter (DMT)-like permease